MAEVGLSVAAKLAEYLVHPTLEQLQYLFCVGKISRNVQIKKEELILKHGRVQERVQEAINRTDRIDGEVDKWKNNVKSLIAEVENLEEQLRANNGCLRGWVPTWMRYRLCKKLANRTQRMIHLNTKSDHFNPFSHPVTVPGIEYHSSQNFKLFDSTRVAFDQLWQALHDDGSSIIGLWGMGGSGKTTLATEVGKKAKESQLFDRVVLTTISQSPNIIQIQDEIADTMGLKLEEKSKTGRAKRIALRFQSGERILIILDDVWAMLNLEDIGIPFGGNHQISCKVVLTTRRSDVCTLMGCQQIIQLNLLKEDEAWALFQTHANVNDAAEEYVARAIVVECKGLPIAIVAMGTCLNGKEVDEMNVMLYKLRNAKPNIVDKGVRDAFACLELSYDYLATQEAKLLLLLCAMFPEDYKIDVEDLFRYGVGLGLCEDVDSFETIRSQVRATIKYLIDSSLLMHFSPKLIDGREYVTMHDIVRDFVLWKASKEDRTIVVNCTKELNKLIDDEGLKDCYAASSWYDEENKFLPFHSELDAPRLKFQLNVPKLKFQLDVPKLKFLMLRSRIPLKISHASFEGAKELQALVIMCINRMKGQLQSIQWSFNLRSLQLRNLDLCDISFVVNLTRLEILDLQSSEFERIPHGIENLNKLKLLDLSNCRIDECCYKVIRRCSQLEELYVPTHSPHSGNTNCYEFLVGPIVLRKLRRYKLEIGHRHGRNLVFENKGVRYLCLSQLNVSMLGSITKDLARRATAIEFNDLKGGSKSFMPNIVQAVGGMHELISLLLQRCSEIECITDEATPHEDAVIPRLDELELRDMNNLKQLHRGRYPFSLFQKLERLTIFNCPHLLDVFPPDCNLGNLKFLSVFNCQRLTSIFSASVACTLLSLERLTIERCSELKHVLEGEGGCDALENSSFPKLKSLSILYCQKLEFVCPTFLALRFVQLQQLSIRSAPKMKFMFDEGKLMHDQDETQILLPLLEYLQLENLPSLVLICSERYHQRWPSIKTINWRDCPNMGLHEVKGHQLIIEELYQPLAAIERIQLDNCVAESIFHHDIGVEGHVPTFQYLKELTLKKCAGLKFVFSAHICQSLLELTYVDISCCAELEAIFSKKEETQKNISIAESCLPKLKKLEISKCDKLKFILSFKISTPTQMFPQLSTLTISDSSQLEEVFKCPNIDEVYDIDCEREIKFPNMKDMKLDNLPRLVNICPGFQLHTGDFCNVKVHHCPKLMPIKTATIYWTNKGRLVKEYELKYSELNNNEVLNLPISVLNAGELDIQSCRVEHKWRVIGDDDQQETTESGQQMVEGFVPTHVFSFQYLHSLEVTHDKRLKFLFSASTVVHNSLPKLTSLAISDCEELEEIIAENREHQIVSNVQVHFPELRELKVERCNKLKRLFSTSKANIVISSLMKMELQNLPNLENVSQGRLQIKVELMRDIIINNCPKFVDSSLGLTLHKQTISDLQELNVATSRNEGFMLMATMRRIQLDNCGVEYIFQIQRGIEEQIPTFQYVKELTLKKCARMKYVFSTHICQILPELTSVTIFCCRELETILLGNEEIEKNLSIAESCLPKLKNLKISECDKLKFVLSLTTNGTTSMFQQLSTLTITDCSQMEEVFKCSNHGIDNEREIKLPNMKDMKLDNLPRLANVLQGFKLHIEGFCRVQVHDCPNLMPIKDATIRWTKKNLVREYVLKYSQLSNNEALNLPLSVLNVGEIDTQSPIVEHTWRVIGDDDKIETNDPGRLMESEQQMVGGGIVPTQVLSFQHLHSLEMVQCVKLKFLFSASIIAHNSLPKLTSLTLSECDEMEELIAENGEHQPIVLSSLRKIMLTNLPNFKSICQGSLQFQVELISDISISNCPKLVDSSMRSALQQLGTISEYCTNDSGMLMRSEQQMVGGAVVSTHVLRFQYLHSLEVTQSKRLKFVFSKSTIVQNSLPKLTFLALSDCEKLEEIFGPSSEEDANSDETIVLSSLREINLKNLPNFKSVCQGRLQIQVELKVIDINNCPKFVDSSLGLALQQLGTISLAQVSTEDSNVFETSSSNNANEERGMMLMISRAEELYLEDSMNLISVWDGPASIIFQNLMSLSVIRCEKLKCMFPNSVIRSLPCLEELHIEECEELEEIIMSSSSEEEHHNHHHFPNDSSNSSLCFPQLQYLDVIRCSKLKWLFPSLPSTQHLPQLLKLTIKECSQLKGLFNNSQVEIHEEEFSIKNMLPCLECFKVEDCPNFSKATLAALKSLEEDKWEEYEGF